MSIETRLQALEAAKITEPDLCYCSQIEIREDLKRPPIEKLPVIYCKKCDLPKMTVWVSCINHSDVDQTIKPV